MNIAQRPLALLDPEELQSSKAHPLLCTSPFASVIIIAIPLTSGRMFHQDPAKLRTALGARNARLRMPAKEVLRRPSSCRDNEASHFDSSRRS